jgi:hypothetical protein
VVALDFEPKSDLKIELFQGVVQIAWHPTATRSLRAFASSFGWDDVAAGEKAAGITCCPGKNVL